MSIGGKQSSTYHIGFCRGPGKIAQKSLPWRRVRFTARAFLLRTKKHGNILIDTGYSPMFFEATSRFPYTLYRRMIPVNYTSTDALVSQLQEEISYLFITHFHADHIAGLKEFAHVPWIYRKDALEKLQKMHPLRAMKEGFFSALIPSIPPESIGLNASDFIHPFRNTSLKCIDVFNDKTLQVVNLPGHALGQMGLEYSRHFYVADAAWSEEALIQGILPHQIGLLLQHSKKDYKKTFLELHQLLKSTPQYRCIPTHTIERLLWIN